jgi:eukaryotic-like serine/threonine-protein kinase
VTTTSSGVYAAAPSGKHYLLWLRGSTLVAQELDPKSLKVIGEPDPIADPVGSLNGVTNVSASGNGLLVYGTSNFLGQFRWFDWTGGPLGNVGEPGEYNAFRLSRDGRRAAVSRNYPQGSDLWLMDTERGVSDRFTGNPGIAAYPVWFPDGLVVVFSTGGPLSLFRKAASGVGAEERLTQSPSLQLATDWSLDGRLLYFEVGPNTQEDIWTDPVTADGRRIPGAEPKQRISKRRFASLTPASHPGRVPVGLPTCLTSLVSSRSIPTPFQSLDTKSAFHRQGACIRSGVMPETDSFMSRLTTR